MAKAMVREKQNDKSKEERKLKRSTRASLKYSTRQTLKNKEQRKQVTSVNEKDKKAVVIAQEIKFARLLASNDKVIRNRVLQNLRKWLIVRSQSSFAFTESDFITLWKGLFYCMWMSDKPLIQEELAESLSKIVHCFKTKNVVLLYTTCALRTLGVEWYGIDQYRLDKFCMLARRIIRQTFQKCKEMLWDIEWVKGISEILKKLLVDPSICFGFTMHITELFLEELSKISGGDIPEDVVLELIKPFVDYFIPMDDERRIRHVMKHIFRYLIFQSDIGMDYMEKFRAWRDAGFPTGSIDAMQKIELSDEEISDNEIGEIGKENFRKLFEDQIKRNEKSLDPRAGRVDVELPQIPFNAKEIAALLDQYKFHPSSTTKSRRQLRRLIKEFTELSQGKMPLGIKEIRIPETSKKETDTKSAAIRLLKFEKELYSDKPQKKRKTKKNGQLVQDESDESNEAELGDNDINDENNSESDSVEINKNETVEEKKKNKRKLGDTDNLISKQSQISGESSFNLKKKRFKAKEKDQNNYAADKKNGNYKLKKELSVLINDTNECKKVKSKGNKNTVSNILNVITQTKRKKLKKLKVSNKWHVSDNVNPIISSPLNGKSVESHVTTVENLDIKDCERKNDILTKQSVWLPILTKLENEKHRIPSSKGQRKINNATNSKKRVKIALQRNTAQHTSEYILQIRKSPAIPFDANKKPPASVLKASPIPSPINPFYKRNIV